MRSWCSKGIFAVAVGVLTVWWVTGEATEQHGQEPADNAGAVVVPVGAVVAWQPTGADVNEAGVVVPPAGWLVCDGSNGAPDLRERFVYGTDSVGEVGSEGGGSEHTHMIEGDVAVRGADAEADTPAPGAHHHVAGAGSNLPPFVRLVYIIAQRAGVEVPLGAVVGWHSTEGDGGEHAPRSFSGNGWRISDGWNGMPDLRGRFIYGTSSMDEVGAEGGESDHSHAVGSFRGGRGADSGRDFLATGYRHTHGFGRSSNLPPWLKLVHIMAEARPVALGRGTVVAWLAMADDGDGRGGVVAPVGWLVCDGTNGTPNLVNRFVYGTGLGDEVGGEGGGLQHSHTISVPGDRGVDGDRGPDPDLWAALGTHTHSVDSASNLPPWVKLVYIMAQ